MYFFYYFRKKPKKILLNTEKCNTLHYVLTLHEIRVQATVVRGVRTIGRPTFLTTEFLTACVT